DVFRSGDSSKKFKIAEGQWYRYAPSYVSPAYHLLEGFPFIQEPPSGDLQERVLIRHQDRKSGSAGMLRPISYAVFCLKKKMQQNIPYLIMEYAPKVSLARLHPKGTQLAIDRVVSYLKQVARGLEYGNDQKKVIHGDIKR